MWLSVVDAALLITVLVSVCADDVVVLAAAAACLALQASRQAGQGSTLLRGPGGISWPVASTLNGRVVVHSWSCACTVSEVLLLLVESSHQELQELPARHAEQAATPAPAAECYVVIHTCCML